jgi:hypothetical protein
VEELSEYYFDNFYKVLVVKSGGEYLVSVDTYIAGWYHGPPQELCIEDACLLYKEVYFEEAASLPCKPARVVIVGSRVRDRVETINVKWVCRERPSDEEVKRLYEISWTLARGHPVA